jgi:glutaredoxin 3
MKEKVVMYSLVYCPYCVRAKSLLSANNIIFEEIVVDSDDDETREKLQKKSGMRTFPQIFYGEQLIGGFSELQKLDIEKGIKNILV